jgi:hypothetical protein
VTSVVWLYESCLIFIKNRFVSGLVLQVTSTVFMVLVWLPVDFLVESAFHSL